MASEIDDKARAVYSDNHKMVVEGDIRAINPCDVPEHDVLTAGFPCQAFSKAGSQLGLKDETRGTLFFDIAQIIEVKKPRYLILENVRNLTRHDQGRTWVIIISRLRELGYRVSSRPLIFSPHLLPASLGGAPQFRERVFILAERADEATVPSGKSELDIDLHLENAPVAGWNPKSWDLRAWLRGLPPSGEDLTPYVMRADEVTRVQAWGELIRRTGLPIPAPSWESEFRWFPNLSDDLPDWKKAFHKRNSDFYREHRNEITAWRRKYRPVDWIDSHRKFEWQAQDWPGDVMDLLINFRPSGIRVKQPNYVPALVAIAQTPVMGWERRRMTPREAASLQGLPADFRLAASSAVAYKQLGNGVNVGVVKYLAQHLFKETQAPFWDKVQPSSVGRQISKNDRQLGFTFSDIR